MENHTTPRDFERWAAKARSMTLAELAHSLIDCARTADAMDALDRAEPRTPCRAGRYRDEASVYRAEMRRRR